MKDGFRSILISGVRAAFEEFVEAAMKLDQQYECMPDDLTVEEYDQFLLERGKELQAMDKYLRAREALCVHVKPKARMH